MGKYILREIVNASKRKMFVVILICIVAVCFVANLAVMAFTLIYGSNIDGVLGSNVLAFGSWCFPIPYLATICMAHLVFGPEYPDPYIKDNITKNISRTGIYLGKLIAALVYAIIFMVVAFIFLLISTRLFHSDISAYDVKTFLSNMLVAVPLWIAGISFGIMFLFMFRRKKKAYIAFYILTLIIPRIIMLFAAEPFSLSPFITVRKILISQSFTHIPYIADPARNVTFIVCEGFVYAVIAAIVGVICYNKKDLMKDN